MTLGKEGVTSDIAYDNLVPKLLEAVPEIQDEYQQALRDRQSVPFTEQDVEDLRQIAEMHKLPSLDLYAPTLTEVIEDMFIPFVVELLKQQSQQPNAATAARLQDILSWVEELMFSQDEHVRNTVAVSICEPLLTNYGRYFPLAFPFTGPKTRAVCKQQLARFRNLRPEVLSLFRESDRPN